MNEAGGPLLEVEGVSVRFGALLAVHQVSLSVRRREIVAIIGPNGAGKTTLLNAVSGFYHPYEGRIAFGGRDRTLAGRPADQNRLVAVGGATGYERTRFISGS